MNKVLVYVVLCNIFVQIDSTDQNSMNLALETVLQFDSKDRATDLRLIDSLQVFLDKVKQVLLKDSPTRRSQITKKNIFTNFLLSMFYIIKEYKDEDLEQVVTILDDAVRKLKNDNANIHGLIGNKNIITYLDDQLEHLRGTPNDEIRSFLENITDFLQNDEMPDKVKDLLDFTNSLYGTDSADKLLNLINNLEMFKNKTKRTNYIDFDILLRQNFDTVILNHFQNLSPSLRREFKKKLNIVWVYYGPPQEKIVNKAKYNAKFVSKPSKSSNNIITKKLSREESEEEYASKIEESLAKINDKSNEDKREVNLIEEINPTDFLRSPHEKMSAEVLENSLDHIKTKQQNKTPTKTKQTLLKSRNEPVPKLHENPNISRIPKTRPINQLNKDHQFKNDSFKSQLEPILQNSTELLTVHHAVINIGVLKKDDYLNKDNNLGSDKDVRSFLHIEQSSNTANTEDKLGKKETFRQNSNKDKKINKKFSSEQEIMSDVDKVFDEIEHPTTTTVNLPNLNKRLDLIERLLIDLKNEMKVKKNVKQDNAPVTPKTRTASISSSTRDTTTSESTSTVGLNMESSPTLRSKLETDSANSLNVETASADDFIIIETTISNASPTDTEFTTTESSSTTAVENNVTFVDEFGSQPDK